MTMAATVAPKTPPPLACNHCLPCICLPMVVLGISVPALIAVDSSHIATGATLTNRLPHLNLPPHYGL